MTTSHNRYHITKQPRLMQNGIAMMSFYLLLTLLLLCSCDIPDDIPYPIVESELTSLKVEGQCDETGTGDAEVRIDKTNRRAEVYVNDLVDITHLRIKKIEATNDAHIVINDTIRRLSDSYPTQGMPTGSPEMTLDFSRPQAITLFTYQRYDWIISVTQVIKREVEVEGQVGDAIIDPDTRVAIIYVNESQDLSAIKVKKFSLGGQHGSVDPDPTQQASVDFTNSRRYYVKNGWSNLIYPWVVYVYQTAGTIQPTIAVTSTAKGASLISGTRPNGVMPKVEYKAASDADWTVASEVRFPTATTYEVELNGLKSDVQYLCRATFGQTVTEEQAFYFEGEQLENSSFDDWHVEGEGLRALYCPWAEGAESYWDTGNHGATTVGASNSTFADEDGRRYANLQSKFIVIKFAAGNIFTGKYVDTDGTNGVLAFGRPFTSRPTQMTFEFQYKTSPITRNGGAWNNAWGQYISKEMYENMKGKPDSCSVFIALGDWTPTTYKGNLCPYLIRTRPSALHLMDLQDPHLIGYAQMTCGHDVSSWTEQTLDIDYRNGRTPTTIIVVASSSKYGDYFTGGEESQMKVDNFKLKY